MHKAFFIVLVLMVSCTPQQRLNRHFDKIEKIRRDHPELFQSDSAVIRDVVVRERVDTFYINDVQLDTIFQIDRDTLQKVDTVRIEQDGIKTQIVIREKTNTITEYEVVTQIDSFMVERVVRDTIFREVIKIEHTNQRRPWWWSSTWAWIGIGLIVLAVVAVRWLQSIHKFY